MNEEKILEVPSVLEEGSEVSPEETSSTEDVEVSSNDTEIITNTVSGNDADTTINDVMLILEEQNEVLSAQSETLETVSDNTELIEAIGGTNYLLSALLFFYVFVWVEHKIANAVKKLFGRKSEV